MPESECAYSACTSYEQEYLQSERFLFGSQGYSPQQGMPEGVTSFAHKAATCSKAPVTPSFFEVQGTWIATLSLTCTQQPAFTTWNLACALQVRHTHRHKWIAEA